ncbi:MAG: hypothetical protein JWO58_2965 [Chitinophagaceae bacterium]|nr:hypothetical protein [Chitinophagaceae bacterium]
MLLIFFNGSLSAQTVDFFIQQGGTKEDHINSITVDEQSNVYATGNYYEETTIGTATLNDYLNSPYWAKFNSTGTFGWAKGLLPDASGNSLYGNSICVSKSGYLYTTGSFGSAMYFTSDNFLELITSTSWGVSDADIYITKYDTTGQLIWKIRAGSVSPGMEGGVDLVLDEHENIYVTGIFTGNCVFEEAGTPFTTGGFGLTTTSYGDQDIFVAKYNSEGKHLGVCSFGGKKQDFVNKMCYRDGSLYLTGTFVDTCYAGDLVVQSISPGTYTDNGFLCKMDTSLHINYLKKFGGSTGYNTGYGICTNEEGDVYLTGTLFGSSQYEGQSFITSNSVNAFLASISATDGTLKWVQGLTTSTSSSYANSYSVTSNTNNDAYITGTFMNSLSLNNGDLLANATPYSNSLFLIKFDKNGTVHWSEQASGDASVVGKALTCSQNKIFMAGELKGQMNWNSTVYNSSGNSYDFFITEVKDLDLPLTTSTRPAHEDNCLVFPNPASDEVHLHFQEPSNGAMEISIYTSTGIQVLHQTIENSAGSDSIILNTGTLHAGIYTLKISTTSEILQKELLIR